MSDFWLVLLEMTNGQRVYINPLYVSILFEAGEEDVTYINMSTEEKTIQVKGSVVDVAERIYSSVRMQKRVSKLDG